MKTRLRNLISLAGGILGNDRFVPTENPPSPINEISGGSLTVHRGVPASGEYEGVEFVLKSYPARPGEWDLLRFWRAQGRQGFERVARRLDLETGLNLLELAVGGEQRRAGVPLLFDNGSDRPGKISLADARKYLARGRALGAGGYAQRDDAAGTA